MLGLELGYYLMIHHLLQNLIKYVQHASLTKCTNDPIGPILAIFPETIQHQERVSAQMVWK
jgi:hypothetical protein